MKSEKLIRSLGAALVLLPLVLGACEPKVSTSNPRTALAVVPEIQSGQSDAVSEAQLTLAQELKFRLETQLKFPVSYLGGHETNPVEFFLTNLTARPAVKALPSELLQEMGPKVSPQNMVLMKLDHLTIATSSGPKPIQTSLLLQFQSPGQVRTFIDGINGVNGSIEVLRSVRTSNGKQTVDAETILRITQTFSNLLRDTPLEATTIVMQKPLEAAVAGQPPTNSWQLSAPDHGALLNQAWKPFASSATISRPEPTTLVQAGDLVRVIDIGNQRYVFMRPVGSTLDTVLSANKGTTIPLDALADLARLSLQPITLRSGKVYAVSDFGLQPPQIIVTQDGELLPYNPYLTLVKANAEAANGQPLYMQTTRISTLLRTNEKVQTATGITVPDSLGSDPIQQDIVQSLDTRGLIPRAFQGAANNMLIAANTALIVAPVVIEYNKERAIASSIDSSFALTDEDKAEVAKDIAQGGNPQCEGIMYQKKIVVPFAKILPAGSAAEIQVPVVMTTESNNGLENVTIQTLPAFTPLGMEAKLSEGNAIGCNPFRFAIQRPDNDKDSNVLFRFDPSADDLKKGWGIEVYDGETKIATIGKPEIMGITTLDYYRGFKFHVPFESEGKSLAFKYSDDKTSVKISRDKENFIFVVEQKGEKS